MSNRLYVRSMAHLPYYTRPAWMNVGLILGRSSCRGMLSSANDPLHIRSRLQFSQGSQPTPSQALNNAFGNCNIADSLHSQYAFGGDYSMSQSQTQNSLPDSGRSASSMQLPSSQANGLGWVSIWAMVQKLCASHKMDGTRAVRHCSFSSSILLPSILLISSVWIASSTICLVENASDCQSSLTLAYCLAFNFLEVLFGYSLPFSCKSAIGLAQQIKEKNSEFVG